MFGEMVGAVLADCWKRAGAPAEAIYAELGPGRGTLAADALRVLRSAGFAGEVHLVETSPMLRQAQEQAMPERSGTKRSTSFPRAPLLLVANEFLDALAGPTACRRGRAASHGRRRRARVRSRRRDRREFARTRRSRRASRPRREMAESRSHRLRPRKSARGRYLQAVRGHPLCAVLGVRASRT